MKRTLSILLIALILLPVTATAQGRRRRPDRGTRWAPDGRHLIIKGQWVDAISGKESTAERAGQKPGKASMSELFRQALSKIRKDGVPNSAFRAGRNASTLPRAPEPRPGMKVSEDGSTAVLIVDGELWAYARDKEAKLLGRDLSGIRHLEIAPEGNAVSYIRDNNIYITGTADGKTEQLSNDGSEHLFYGELDWVYQEEVYGRYNFKGTWWAPHDKHMIFMRINEEGVDTFTVVDHIPQALNIEHIKYPKAGTTNPRATLAVARAKGGKVVPIDLSGYKLEDEILIVRVGWTPEGNEAVFMVQNREQTWLDLCFANPDTGRMRKAIHENCEDGWVNRLPMPRWLKDGTFIWESERTGFKHLYHYDRKGKLLTTVTSGEWMVRSIVRLDEERKHVTFYATKDGAIGPNAYRVGLNGKGLTRLTKGRGSHRISLNEDGTLLVDTFSSLVNPGEEWLRRADGTDVRQIKKPPEVSLEGLPELSRIKARDGEWLDVAVTKPAGFDSNTAYPVWLSTYSGPDAPSLRDSWRRGGTREGTVSLTVNVRTASGRGMKYTKQCYRQLGVQELRDLEDAVRWLTKEPWADAARVGISGGSYGGFMAAYALTNSTVFKVGVASSGVFDWKLYDTIYTERYMATPQNNPEGYKVTSVVENAKNLNGHLLIIHGTMDDNVHMQNAIQFIHELQKADKDFEFMVYPKSRHGIRSGHVRMLQQRFIKEHL